MAHTARDTAPPTRATARTTYLKGRATALRKLADTIDIRSIRDRVLALAEECVQLARLVEREGQAGRSELPIRRRSPAKP
jgi:hypothetical protein